MLYGDQVQNKSKMCTIALWWDVGSNLSFPSSTINQNLIQNHFWVQSGAGKMWPQAVLGQPFYHPVSLTGPDLKLPGATLSWPLIDPKNGLVSGFDLRN